MRVRVVNDRPLRAEGRYVVYWMTMFRRPHWNFALERAARWAKRLERPLVVLEPLRIDYPYANERLHRFVLEGMRDNATAFADEPVAYYPYVEPAPGAGKGLLAALAAEACLVVGDDYPGFMLPRMLAGAAAKLPCRYELVDANGLLPMAATPRVFTRAVDFRRFLQKELADWLADMPAERPLRELGRKVELPAAVLKRWPAAQGDLPSLAATLPVDHAVPPAAMRGGYRAAAERMERFLNLLLAVYPAERNDPEVDCTSRFSPYLHFGHLSVHQVFARLAEIEGWRPDSMVKKANGKKEGWWGMSTAAEAFLDELVTWRELGFNFASKRADYADYESLPAWARETLEAHVKDERRLYAIDELEAARTHDPLWNAAMNQLKREGWFHNYLRMLWGKKILEWSPTPRDALRAMEALMNRYSLDGRGPNAYTGYFWTLGRFDRPWAPERPVFGTVRYMSSQNTARKLRVDGYVRKYA